MRKIFLLLLVVVPQLLLAQGLENALGALAFAMLVLGIVIMIGLISAVIFLIKGSRWSYLVSIAAALLLLFFSVLVSYPTEDNLSGSKILYNAYLLIVLPLLLIIFIVSLKKSKQQPLSLVWFWLVSSMLLITAFEIKQAFFFTLIYHNLNLITFLIYIIFGLYFYTYAQRALVLDSNIDSGKLYKNVNLLCFLSLNSSLIYNYFMIKFLDPDIGYNIFDLYYNFFTIIIFVIPFLFANLSTFFALKKYRNLSDGHRSS